MRADVEVLLRLEQPARGFLAAMVDEMKETLSTSAFPTGEHSTFEGNERFALRRKLGSGGFGTVYEAYDREQNATVALKTLDRAGAMDILRFKNEFRSLVDITHRNLVPLYELLCERGHWFFTMELVNGGNFLQYVRGGEECPHIHKLRSAFAQLAAGVNALHESGRLHCDLKPSNVLVTNQGSVRIVDFGLVLRTGEECGDGRSIAGTPVYMAPERLKTGASSTSSDWYSVGVMLYEALTGRLPHDDADHISLMPDDLGQLCRQLLTRDASARPSADAILRLLNISEAGDNPLASENVFVGREQEIASLRQALQSVKPGNAVTVCVAGNSGSGKTTLIQHFIQLARQDQDVLAFSGRCFEQESVPYNALDDMVDSVAAYLGKLPRAQSRELMDGPAALAARLFPVLEPFAAPASRGNIVSQELQQAAFAAFRTLLKRLSERRRLMIHLDDLQWANPDSLELLNELLRQPGAPSMLMIASFRPDSREALAGIEQQARFQIELEPLTPADANKLASMLIPEIPRRAEWVTRIAAESGGNPFLLGELAHYAYSADDAAVEAAVSLDYMLQARFSNLTQPARELLEVVAVAGHPVEVSVAWKAARYEEAQQSALALLRARRLVRLRRIQATQEIEMYHDRLRATVQSGMPLESRKRRHLDLALELEKSPLATPESLAVHFYEGGEAAKAFHHAVAAADAASRSLAFESAARWSRLALSVRDDLEVRVRLADALSSSGRGKEAADIYLACMNESAGTVQLDLHRRAATDLLISGHTQEGVKVLEDALRRIGVGVPPAGIRAIPSLLLNRAWIRIRGLQVPSSPAAQLSSRDVERVDACWSVTRGFGMVDTIRAAEFHARYLLLTLRTGDPYRVARALCVEAGYCALSGDNSGARVQSLLHTASRLADEAGNPHGIAMVVLVSGMAAFLAGNWARACERLEEAERLLRETCSGAAWELATTRLMGAASAYFLGEINQLAEKLPVILQNARARGDLFESTIEIRIAHVLRLAADEPDAAKAGLAAASNILPKSDFYMPHWWALIAGVEIAIYSGDAAGAWRLVESQWRALRRSLLMHTQYVRIESLFHRARAALALASVAPGEKKRLLRSALADAAVIQREKSRWGIPVAALIRAGAAGIDGRCEAALVEFEFAETGFRNVDMKLFAAAARRRRGVLIGGDEGRAMVNEADVWMCSQQIRNVDRITAMLAPG